MARLDCVKSVEPTLIEGPIFEESTGESTYVFYFRQRHILLSGIDANNL